MLENLIKFLESAFVQEQIDIYTTNNHTIITLKNDEQNAKMLLNINSDFIGCTVADERVPKTFHYLLANVKENFIALKHNIYDFKWSK